MSERPEILFLVHRIPYPPNKGDKIRSWRLLNELAAQYRVHLACFVDDPADFAHAPVLHEICASATLVPLGRRAGIVRSIKAIIDGAPLTAAYFHDEDMAHAVAAIRARPLAAEIAFSSTMAAYIEEPIKGRPRIVDFCDADSEKFFDYAAKAAFPMRQVFSREGRLLYAMENEVANWADASFAITSDEASRFNMRHEISEDVRWWSNGVDTKYFDPHADFSRSAPPIDLIFTGAMDYRANIDAVNWFARKVWPDVRRAFPAATFAVVGARPTRAVRRLGRITGVRVIGRVDDMRPWLESARVAIAPMQVARGIQNKVLEGMAMGKPVIATKAAATGIAVKPGIEILLADTPHAFAAATIDLLKNASRRQRTGAAARERVAADYQWDRQLSRFSEALSALLPPAETSSTRESSAA